MIKIDIPQSDLKSLVDAHWTWFELRLNDKADWFESSKKKWKRRNIITRKDFILKTLNLSNVDDIKHIIQASFQEMKNIISNHPQWTFPKRKGTDYKLRDAIQRAFGYKEFTSLSNTEEGSLKLFNDLKLSVCPYCNSERIGVLTNKQKKYNYKTPMDHFFPESRYPVLSCSFYNIIPACTTCNTLKKDLDTYIDEIIYPHLEQFGKEGCFRCRFDLRSLFCAKYQFDQRILKKIDVRIKPPKGNKLPVKIQNSVEKLDIDSVYTDLHQDDVKSLICACRSSVSTRVKFLAKFRFDKEKILEKLHPHQRPKGLEYPLRKFEEDVLEQVKEFL